MPEAIYLSPYDDAETFVEIWRDPDGKDTDTTNAPIANEAGSSFEWLGHTLRAQFASRERAVAYEGISLYPANGIFIMVRFLCDGIPLSELYANKESILMLDENKVQLDSASIRVDGVVLTDDMQLDGACDQFDALFLLNDYDAYPSLIFELFGENGDILLPMQEIAQHDYTLFDVSVPENERDFTWVLEHMDGENDAYKLLFALCEAKVNVEVSYIAALEYADVNGLYDEFMRLCSEVVAAKKYNMPNDELLAYLEEHLLYADSDTGANYRAYLINEMNVSAELLDIMDDGGAQYGYRSALWTDSALEGFYGEGLRTFVPDSPRKGVFLIALSPDTELKPNMTTAEGDEKGEYEAWRYACDIADYLDTMFAEMDYTPTGNPNIASVMIEIDMDYHSAGQYQGTSGIISAYNSECTLRAYDMTSGELIAQITGTRSYGSTISTYQKSGTIWCDAPNMTEAEGAEEFVNAVISHVPGTSVAPYEMSAGMDKPAVAESTPEPTTEPTAEPTAEPTPEPETDSTRSILQILDDPLYAKTYEYLAAGNTIRKGENSDYGRGLQMLLIALGRDITIDGQVGNKTITALNDVYSGLGMTDRDGIDAPGFGRLLACRLCLKDEDAAYDALVGSMSEDEFTYLCACGFELTGQYYKAYQKFCLTGWKDANERAEACAREWPKNGEVYRNSAYSGKKTYLHIKIDSQDDGQAALIKIYANNGDLVSCLFIGGAGKVTAKIPGGTYIVKMGVGENWFGVEDAFGSKGTYQTMLFDGGAETVTLQSGYEYTLTINTSVSDPAAEGVGSEYEEYEGF